MDRSTKSLSGRWLCLAMLVALGCEQGPEYVVDHLALHRTNWDTLAVDVQFSQRGSFGGMRSIEPSMQTVYLFNASYDTLYAGESRVVPIADTVLGSEERLMLEVCGRFESMLVCEQEAVMASPKRLYLEHDIRFPEDPKFEKGSYDLRFVVERQIYGAEEWERLGQPDNLEGYLLAYIGDRAEEAVKVPFSRNRGRFSLQGKPRYSDFAFHLKSMLMDEREAQVRFDVYAGLNGQAPDSLASVEMLVREKTTEERALEVRAFAEQAADKILERLIVSNRSARVYIDAWTFNPVTNVYLVEMEVIWRQGRLLRGRRYELEGLLEVAESGENARFLRQGGNRQASRRWASEVRGRMLSLGALEPYTEDGEPQKEDRMEGARAEPTRERAEATASTRRPGW